MSKQSSMSIQALAEGQRIERAAELADEKLRIKAEVDKLLRNFPRDDPDRTMFLRNLVQKALKGDISEEVFSRFAQTTGTWTEISNMLPRAKRGNPAIERIKKKSESEIDKYFVNMCHRINTQIAKHPLTRKQEEALFAKYKDMAYMINKDINPSTKRMKPVSRRASCIGTCPKHGIKIEFLPGVKRVRCIGHWLNIPKTGNYLEVFGRNFQLGMEDILVHPNRKPTKAQIKRRNRILSSDNLFDYTEAERTESFKQGIIL